MAETDSLPPPWKRPVQRMVHNWLIRHRHPVNFWLHVAGIPLALAGVVLLIACQPWYWGVAAFALGYVLQYLGHCVEGNDLGEWAGLKRLFGLPYTSVAPPRKQAANLEEAVGSKS